MMKFKLVSWNATEVNNSEKWRVVNSLIREWWAGCMQETKIGGDILEMVHTLGREVD